MSVAAVDDPATRPDEVRDIRALGARLAAFVALAVAAVVSRFYALGDRSIWLDEAWGWRATRLPFRAMLDWAADSKDPPLYYAILTRWVDVAGDGESALRAPSALASALTVVLLAYAGYRSGGFLLGIAASSALLLNASNIEFAQEARMYPLVGLFALASAIALGRMLERPDASRAAIYVASALALVYTHYSGLVCVGLQALLIGGYGLARLRRNGDRRILAFGGASLALLGLAYIPWFPHLLHHAGAGAGYIAPPDAAVTRQALRVAFGVDALGVVSIPVAVAVVALGVSTLVRRRANPIAVCVSGLAAVPVVLLLISIAWTPVFDLRQASPYTAGAAFLAGLAIVEAYEFVAGSRESFRMVGIAAGSAVLAVLMVTATRQILRAYDTGPVEDWRGAAALATRNGGPVLVWRRYSSTPLSYYLPADSVIREIPPALLLGQPFENESNGSATLILSHETPAEADKIMSMLGKQYQIGPRTALRGISLYTLEVREHSSNRSATDWSPECATTWVMRRPDDRLASGAA